MSRVYPEAIKHLPKTQQMIIVRLYNRVSRDNKNALIAVTGSTGSGKSYAVLSLLIGLYLYQNGKYPPLEYVKHHSVFKSKDFMNKINDPNLKPMETWLFDEVGVEANSKNHATNHNKTLNFLVQTFRHLQQIVFFTTPSFSFLDKSIRNMIHYKLETVSINKPKKTNKCKFFYLQYNERKDKVYFKFIQVKVGKYSAKVKRVNTLLAPKEYVKQYEQQKEEFSLKLRLGLVRGLEKAEQKEEEALSPTRKPLTERQEKIMELLNSGTTSRKEIAEKLRVNVVNISKNIRFMRNKGYNIPNNEKIQQKPRLTTTTSDLEDA